jgi:hypothetical protein
LLLQYYFSMFFLLLYINLYIHYVAHLTMTTFVQEHLLYLIVYPMKIELNKVGTSRLQISTYLSADTQIMTEYDVHGSRQSKIE